MTAGGLAYKAYEIEELVDIYFYRRLGWIVARAAQLLGATPNAVSVAAGLVGAAGGALLYDQRFAWTGVALLILHGVFDSADGQLARLTGQVSEWGRVLDGAAGYATHVAMYLAIGAGVFDRTGSASIFVWVVAAGLCNAIQASMYDYHRTAYARVVVSGLAPAGLTTAQSARALTGVVAAYERLQQGLTGAHAAVEQGIAERAVQGRVQDHDRQRYRAVFYRRVLGWNLLGDNMRRYAIAAAVALHRPDWFLLFILVPMNVVLVVMWFWQQLADHEFLSDRRIAASS